MKNRPTTLPRSSQHSLGAFREHPPDGETCSFSGFVSGEYYSTMDIFIPAKKKSEGAFAIRLHSPHAVMKMHRLIPVLPGSEQVQGISPEPASQVFLRQFLP